MSAMDPDHFQGQVGDVIGEKYQLVQKLGEGFFGVVWKAERVICPGSYMALKICKNRASFLEAARSEIKNYELTDGCSGIMNMVEHFILQCHDHQYIVIVFDLMDTDLLTCVEKGLSPRFHATVFQQVLLSLHQLHERGLIHTDLKPENVLLRFYPELQHVQIKLGDLGNCCRKYERLTNHITTRYYRAPEVIVGGGFDEKTDIFSCGCMFFELVTGKVLFDPHSFGQGVHRKNCIHLNQIISVLQKPLPLELMQKSYFGKWYQKALKPLAGSVPPEMTLAEKLKGHSPLLIDLLSHMLDPDPRSRCSAAQALQHAFFL